MFDRSASNFTSATLEAKIYIVESTSTTEHNNALIAIHQGDASNTEAYYRFGYRNGTVYLQKFNGTNFTLIGEDTSLPGTNMTIPGWNLFTLQFVGSDTINCSVNGVPASFSPVTDTEPTIDTAIQIGMLGFSMSSQDPILGDDFHEKIVTKTAGIEEWYMY